MHMDLKKSPFAKLKYLKVKLSRQQTPAAIPAQSSMGSVGGVWLRPCDHSTSHQPQVSS